MSSRKRFIYMTALRMKKGELEGLFYLREDVADCIIPMLIVVVALTYTMFTNIKFIHPVRTSRWYEISLGVCIAWIVLAGWAAWWDFNEGPIAKWLLVLTSLYLCLAGIAQQIIPEGIRRVS